MGDLTHGMWHPHTKSIPWLLKLHPELVQISSGSLLPSGPKAEPGLACGRALSPVFSQPGTDKYHRRHETSGVRLDAVRRGAVYPTLRREELW